VISLIITSGPPTMLTSNESDSLSTWPPSNNGWASSFSMTCSARFSPAASAVAKKLAAWRPRVTEQRSAKSTLINPVWVSMRQMPRKPSASRLLLILNPSSTLVFSSSILKSFWLGRQMTASACGFELLQSGLGLELAAIALEIKRQRDQGQHQRAAFPRHARENRRRAGAGAAAQAGQEKNDVGPGAEGTDFLHVLLGRRAAQLGVAARAQAARAAGAEDEFGRRGAGVQRLGIGVDSQEFDAGKTGLGGEAGGVAAGAAEAKDFEDDFLLDGRFRGFFKGMLMVTF
jgi:hypothetical protein